MFPSHDHEGRLDAPNLENVKKSIEADVAQAYDYDLQEYQEAKEEIKKDRAIVTPDGRTLAEVREEQAGVGDGLVAKLLIEAPKNLAKDIIEGIPELVAAGVELPGEIAEGTINRVSRAVKLFSLIKNAPSEVIPDEEKRTGILKELEDNLFTSLVALHNVSPPSVTKMVKSLGATEKEAEDFTKDIANAPVGTRVTADFREAAKEIADPIRAFGKKQTETIGQAVKSIDDSLRQSELGKTISDAAHRAADPQLSIGEDIISEVLAISANVRALRKWTTGDRKKDSATFRRAFERSTDRKKKVAVQKETHRS